MATVGGALQLISGMPDILNNSTNFIDLMINRINKISNSLNVNINFNKTIISNTNQLAISQNNVTTAINQSINAQSNFNKQVDAGGKKSDSLFKKISDGFSRFHGKEIFDFLKGSVTDSLKESTSTTKLSQTLHNRMGMDSGEIDGFIGSLKNMGKTGAVSYGALLEGATKMAEYTNDPKAVISTMESLSDVAATKYGTGTTGDQMSSLAAEAGKMFSGQSSSLIPQDKAAAFKGGTDMEKASKFAQVTAMSYRNMNEAIANTPTGKLQKFQDALGYMRKTIGDAIIPMLVSVASIVGPVIDKINSALQSDQMQAFFGVIYTLVTWITQVIVGIIDAVTWLAGAIQQHWGAIEPILVVIGSTLAAWAITQIPLLYAAISKVIIQFWKNIPSMIAKLWGMLPPVLAQAGAWLAINWPIALIAAVIGLLIYAMIRFGDTVVQVVGFVGGLFGVFFAFLFNRFAVFANDISSFAEFLWNVFQDPVYAIKKLFFELAINCLSYVENLAKGIESVLNSISGIKLDITSRMGNILKTLKSERDKLKSDDDDVISIKRFEQIDYGEAFKKGQYIGTSAGQWTVDKVQGAAGVLGDMFGKFGDMFKMPDKAGDSFISSDKPEELKIPSIDSVNKVNELGAINNTVDISSEDIKTMRELAELKNIQNFVSLTPTVAVQTGDINNGYDVDTIISRITNTLQTQIAESAEGVYAY